MTPPYLRFKGFCLFSALQASGKFKKTTDFPEANQNTFEVHPCPPLIKSGFIPEV